MPRYKNFRFGISSLCYPWAVGMHKGPKPKRRMSSLDLVEKAHSLGISVLQITDNLPLENLPWETMIRLKRTANSLGVKIEVGTKGMKLDHLYKFLEIAEFLGSPLLRILPAFTARSPDLTGHVENLETVLPEFEKAGVTIMLENQEPFKSLEYRKIMERVNHPHLKMCINPVRGLSIMEGPEHVINELGQWCGMIHFTDVAFIHSESGMGIHVEGRPSGQGQLSLPGVLEKLKKNDSYPTVIIGLWPPWQGNIEKSIRLERQWVGESVEYLKSLI